MRREEPEQSPSVRAARYVGFGFEFAGAIVAGLLLGNYLDGWLGTAPLLTLAATLAAMAGAVWRLIWSLKQNSSHREK